LRLLSSRELELMHAINEKAVDCLSDEESSNHENEEINPHSKRGSRERRKRRPSSPQPKIRRSRSASEISSLEVERENSMTSAKEESKLEIVHRTLSNQDKDIKQQDSKLSTFSKKANRALGRLWNPSTNTSSPKDEAVSPKKDNKKEEVQKQRKRSNEKNIRPASTPRY